MAKVLVIAWLVGCTAFVIGKWCMWVTHLVADWPASGFWFLAIGPGPFILLMAVLMVRFISRIEKEKH